MWCDLHQLLLLLADMRQRNDCLPLQRQRNTRLDPDWFLTSWDEIDFGYRLPDECGLAFQDRTGGQWLRHRSVGMSCTMLEVVLEVPSVVISLKNIVLEHVCPYNWEYIEPCWIIVYCPRQFRVNVDVDAQIGGHVEFCVCIFTHAFVTSAWAWQGCVCWVSCAFGSPITYHMVCVAML